METRIIRKEDKCYIELPAEFLAVETAELFKLKEGYYLVTNQLREIKQSQADKVTPTNYLSQEEKLLLKKMLGIRFEKRTPPGVGELINSSENEILKKLMQKGIVTIYKSAKYPDGVYNIIDRAYDALKEQPSGQIAQQKEDSRKTPETKNADYANYVALNTTGYMIIDDNKQAFAFSESMKRLGKANDMVGIKGFDNKFYVATKKYIIKVSTMIKEHMKDDIDVPTLSQKCKVETDGCRAVLKIMAEQGETVEKRRDVFGLI
ncbi:MAG: hypothetical protein Q7S22_06655 [Candidatus Micrarchaeota archaeon]|nr:hypothetical protein [Candidatus Micrarchaeota archaeon]